MSYQDEGRAASALWRAWEASHDDKLGDLSLKRLDTEDRRHTRMLRLIRVAGGDGNRHVLKRRAT